MMGNGKGIVRKGMGCKFGQMERGMKGIGRIIKHMGKGNFYMLMGMCMKENG
jgi:hypothetical protein